MHSELPSYELALDNRAFGRNKEDETRCHDHGPAGNCGNHSRLCSFHRGGLLEGQVVAGEAGHVTQVPRRLVGRSDRTMKIKSEFLRKEMAQESRPQFDAKWSVLTNPEKRNFWEDSESFANRRTRSGAVDPDVSGPRLSNTLQECSRLRVWSWPIDTAAIPQIRGYLGVRGVVPQMRKRKG